MKPENNKNKKMKPEDNKNKKMESEDKKNKKMKPEEKSKEQILYFVMISIILSATWLNFLSPPMS